MHENGGIHRACMHKTTVLYPLSARISYRGPIEKRIGLPAKLSMRESGKRTQCLSSCWRVSSWQLGRRDLGLVVHWTIPYRSPGAVFMLGFKRLDRSILAS